MTLEERRDNEIEFYRRLYSETDYGRGSTRHKHTDKLCMRYGQRADLKRWVDVGAGQHVIKVPPNITELVRVDPANETADYRLAMHELPGDLPAPFDVVTSFDVLEHLLPEELDNGINALWGLVRPGGRMIVSVGTDKGGPWLGRTTHLTQRAPIWWETQLEFLLATPARHVFTSKGTSPFYVLDKP